MPKIENGPKERNSLLESAYSSCMLKYKNETKCSKIALGAASNAGWTKGKDGKWHKKSEAELKKDELAKKGGINRNKNKGEK